MCFEADPGYHVPTLGSIFQIICTQGTYQPSTSQSSCIEADPGYFVSTEGALVQTPAPLDYYVEGIASINPEPCPEIHMTLENASTSPDDCHLDSEGDRIPDYDDEDDDNDGQLDSDDQCSPGETGWISGKVEDKDDDGCRDSTEDDDDDNDGRLDSEDAFPTSADEQDDNDGDGIGDNADMDDDNDGLTDSRELQIGTDPFDSDTDDDGHSDFDDEFPLDSSEWLDSDGDGTGDNTDFVKGMARYQTPAAVLIDLVVGVGVVIAANAFIRSRAKNKRDDTK